ncbi:MAG: heparin lyase I family protein [Solirubrobacterales bacterium]
MGLIVIVTALLVIQLAGDGGDPDRGPDDSRPAAAAKGLEPGQRCPIETPASPIGATLPGCEALLSDTAADEDLGELWGDLACEEERHERREGDGDTHPQADGAPAGDSAYRRFRVIDGDDEDGERCELGENDRDSGPTVLYEEGERRVTFLSARLPSDFPLGDDGWQVIMQMKQTQPAANGSGTPVLALEAWGGRWRLRQSKSSGPASDARQLWSAPAQPLVWTRFALDVTYSQNPATGRIVVNADLNGDGDFDDPGERSAPLSTYTLKVETEGDDDDDLPAGESIPSHLRAGLYHDPGYDCPPPLGCYVDLDNVQVLGP